MGCGGEVSRPGQQGIGGEGGFVSMGGSGGTGIGGTSNGGTGNVGSTVAPPVGPFPTPNEALTACAEPGQVVAMLSSVADMKAWLARSWMFCSGSYLFASAHDGVEFTSDGDWYFLDLVDGQLVRREGFEGSGEWTAQQNGDSVQVDIIFQGGAVFTFMTFAVSPLKVHMGTGGDGIPPDYIAVSG